MSICIDCKVQYHLPLSERTRSRIVVLMCRLVGTGWQIYQVSVTVYMRCTGLFLNEWNKAFLGTGMDLSWPLSLQYTELLFHSICILKGHTYTGMHCYGVGSHLDFVKLPKNYHADQWKLGCVAPGVIRNLGWELGCW